MSKSANQKQKLLYLIDYLKKNTDDTHVVSTAQIIEYMASNGIKVERKTVYADIDTLCEYGYDVIRVGGKSGGYFLGARDFELAEVKLLVDLVQSSKFITTSKSRELIRKLEKEVSRYDAGKLHRQVVVADRNKTSNENIYYSVDVIYEAIAHNVKVKYQYFEWDEKKQQRLRKDGDYYKVSPWLLTWEDENYYLMAYDDEAGILKHYRVDKMLHIELTNEVRTGEAEFAKVDVASFSKKTFGMFAGEERTLQLVADASMTSVLVDRFGRDVPIRRLDEKNVLVRANVAVSPHFYGWLAGFAGKISIYGPADVKESYREYIKELLENI
ncbi:MAG: WYL domain-containing protein [Agathobacter sp.]|nr:WYL domain-containing protein [Agathobacter sp.]